MTPHHSRESNLFYFYYAKQGTAMFVTGGPDRPGGHSHGPRSADGGPWSSRYSPRGQPAGRASPRSEERRVGKGCRSRGAERQYTEQRRSKVQADADREPQQMT